MSSRFTGTLCGIAGAACYATNPLGSLFLYADGVNVHSVLFHRFALAALMLGLWLLCRRTPLRVTRRELGILAVLGTLFGLSAYCLYASFLYLSSGVAGTLLFVYPAMVALLSALFLQEHLRPAALLAVLCSTGGAALLYRGSGGICLHGGGVVLVLLAALSYALYIVIIKGAGFRMAVDKMTFYLLLFCLLTIGATSFFSPAAQLHALPAARDWFWVSYLAAVPSIAAMALLTLSIRAVGATAAAVVSSLQPIITVGIGCAVFHEPFSARYAVGIALIVGSVTSITARRAR